ncbi:MAG: NusG domain II-containing protein [Firmicutes bacterium]|nr:NusG domain II-containing protein [Bacillota bacterium]
MFKVIRKADIVLAVLLAALAVFLIAVPFKAAGASGRVPEGMTGPYVHITLGSEVYGDYSLNQDTTVTIDQGSSHNVVTIQGGKVRMKESNCRNQVCVQEGTISTPGQSIVCLPHRLSVQIIGSSTDEDGYDAIAK